MITIYFIQRYRYALMARCNRSILNVVSALAIASAALPSVCSAATLTANTTARPNMCLFKPGEAVSIKFDATGVTTGQTLTMTVKDAMDVVVQTQSFAVNAAPNWTVTATAYNGKLGFFRVFGTLSDGTSISALGSRPAGFTTYAIVPDPSLRPGVTESQGRFGVQGGVNQTVGADILAFMGWRWAIDGNWNWKNVSPTYGGAFVTPAVKSYAWATNGAGGAWTVLNLPNLTKDGRPYGGSPDVYKAGTFAYNTGALDTPYYDDWENFCAQVAIKWPALYTTRTQPIYEVTWEPVQSWGYKGTDADLVKMYELAYNKIRTISAAALPAGPCMHINSSANLTQQYELFDLGLGNYIGAYTAHPYMEYDIVTSSNPFKEPELTGQPCLMRTMKNKLRAYKGGVDIPMIGTEQGYRTRQDVTREILQAQRLVRANLLVLGEGWRANTAFYFADYYGKDNVDNNYYWDYGLFYNLDTASYGGYSPTKVSPKPVVAAYSAMTFLLERRHPVCDINWMGDTVRGYAFQYSDNVLLALWSVKSASTTVTVPVGVSSVEVYDMWGNKTVTATSGGNLTLTLTQSPTYIKNVANSLWSTARPNRNISKGKAVTVSSTESAASSGDFAVDGDSVSYLSRWESAVNTSKPSHWIEVDLGASSSINEIRFWTGDYFAGSGNSTYNSPLSSYQLQYWNGSAWVNIVSRSGNTKAVVAEAFATLTTSKVRLYVPPYLHNQVMLYEIEVLKP